MLKTSDARRRALGTLLLGGALVMLVWGQTALKPALKGLPFILYWTACMGLTFLALMVALLDLWIVRRRAREESSRMLRETLLDIQARKEAEAKRSDASEAPEKADDSPPA